MTDFVNKFYNKITKIITELEQVWEQVHEIINTKDFYINFTVMSLSFQPHQSLETALVNGCSQLSSLVAHSPEGWGSMVLQWSIRVLACVSSLNTSSSFTSSPHEKVQYWMEQPCELLTLHCSCCINYDLSLVIKQLVGFVTTGIRHR